VVAMSTTTAATPYPSGRQPCEAPADDNRVLSHESHVYSPDYAPGHVQPGGDDVRDCRIIDLALS
jgi:hypothetical protein